MTTVGFKRATIGIFDDSGALVDSHVFEGQTNEVYVKTHVFKHAF